MKEALMLYMQDQGDRFQYFQMVFPLLGRTEDSIFMYDSVKVF
jgi:hypothetical protein